MSNESTKVVLIKEHTHNNQSHPAGASLTVLPHEAQWLVENEVATLQQEVKLNDQTTKGGTNGKRG